MHLKNVLLIGVCAVVVSACAGTLSAPKALTPQDVPAAFEQTPSATAPIWPTPDWWRNFGSTELDQLIATTQTQNLNLAAAEARVLQADARVRLSGAALLPSELSSSRTRVMPSWRHKRAVSAINSMSTSRSIRRSLSTGTRKRCA
jgi:outer membrane protein TolC